MGRSESFRAELADQSQLTLEALNISATLEAGLIQILAGDMYNSSGALSLGV